MNRLTNFVVILLLTGATAAALTTTASAAPVLDGRLAWLSHTAAKGEATFAGSLRFVDAPDAKRFELLRQLGIEFFEHDGRPSGSRTVFAARIPFERLAELAELDWLVAVECAWRPDSAPPLVRSTVEVGATDAWLKPPSSGGSLDGRGVVVCDIDTGINYLHAAFFEPGGELFNWLDVDMSGDLSPGDAVDLDHDGLPGPDESLVRLESAGSEEYGNSVDDYDPRFDWLYNDADRSGTRDGGAPRYGEDDPCYGEVFFIADDADDDGRLDPGEMLIDLDRSKVRAILGRDGVVRRRGVDLLEAEIDTWGHGTQVSGIIGGGWAGKHAMSGMAPGVEMLHVELDFAAEPPFLIPIEAGLAWAVAEGADIVLIEDGEWVWQYLDGSSNLETMINEFAADENVVFVVPAGNLATGHMHTSFASGDGDILRTLATQRIVWPSFLWTDDVDLSLTMMVPGGVVAAIPADGSTITVGNYSVYSNVSVSPRGTRRLDLRLEAATHGVSMVGDWRFAFSGPQTTVHGYFGDDTYSWYSVGRWLGSEDMQRTVTWPATADSAIVVTAYNLEADGDIDTYSGWGPRIDGRPAVDLAAPGRFVASPSHLGVSDFSWFSGTSGAAPHVAGAVALLKQLIPDLDSGACRRALRASAARDVFTGDPDRWGDGKLRIDAAVALILDDIATCPEAPALELVARPNPFNPQVTIAFRAPQRGTAHLRLFDLAGREVWQRRLDVGTDEDCEVVWTGVDARGRSVASGVYLAHIRIGDDYAVARLSLVR